MTTLRSRRPAALLAPVLLSLALAGCGAAQGAEDAPPEMASVAESADGGPAIVTLSEQAEQRLEVATARITESASRLSVPYAAIVYDADGSSWVFTRVRPHTYQRAEVSVGHKTGDQVELTSGPPAGTEVVTVGAAELVGVETGIDGEE